MLYAYLVVRTGPKFSAVILQMKEKYEILHTGDSLVKGKAVFVTKRPVSLKHQKRLELQQI